MEGIYKVYARQDESGNVTRVFSSCFEQAEKIDVLLKEGAGDEYVHVQGAYDLYDEYGRYNYKIVGGAMVEIAESDKPPIPAPLPSQEEINAMLMLEIAKMKAREKA